MNEKRTSDKGQHSCRDAFVLLFICPMNGISFRKDTACFVSYYYTCTAVLFTILSFDEYWFLIFKNHKSTLIQIEGWIVHLSNLYIASENERNGMT